MEYFPVYLEFIKIKMKSIVEYRGAFFLTLFSKGIVFIVSFLLLWILINRFDNIAGWGPYEVMFLYALNLASYSFAGFFLFHACRLLPQRIQRGEFDDLLTKPFNPFLFLICKEFSTNYISNVTVALCSLVLCLVKLQFEFNISNMIFLLVFLFGATLIHGAIFLFTSVPAFWLVQSDGITRFVSQFEEFIKYPISIYPTFIQAVLTFILPFAFINYYPAQFFLNKEEHLFHPILQYLTPLVGVLLFAAAYQFWKFGLKNYKSTGS